MTLDQITLFTLFGLVFALLIWGRFRYDLVAFSALLVVAMTSCSAGQSNNFCFKPIDFQVQRSQ
mgnify:CR=1 FL=1